MILPRKSSVPENIQTAKFYNIFVLSSAREMKIIFSVLLFYYIYFYMHNYIYMFILITLILINYSS